MITRGFSTKNIVTRGMGKTVKIIVDAWRDVKEFTLKIQRIVTFDLER